MVRLAVPVKSISFCSLSRCNCLCTCVCALLLFFVWVSVLQPGFRGLFKRIHQGSLSDLSRLFWKSYPRVIIHWRYRAAIFMQYLFQSKPLGRPSLPTRAHTSVCFAKYTGGNIFAVWIMLTGLFLAPGRGTSLFLFPRMEVSRDVCAGTGQDSDTLLCYCVTVLLSNGVHAERL